MGGGRSRGGGCAPPQKKIEFLPENGGFWCILGLLFTFMQKLVRSMGGAAAPTLDPPLAAGPVQSSESSPIRDADSTSQQRALLDVVGLEVLGSTQQASDSCSTRSTHIQKLQQPIMKSTICISEAKAICSAIEWSEENRSVGAW